MNPASSYPSFVLALAPAVIRIDDFTVWTEKMEV
jgi:hypothetical protein